MMDIDVDPTPTSEQFQSGGPPLAESSGSAISAPQGHSQAKESVARRLADAHCRLHEAFKFLPSDDDPLLDTFMQGLFYEMVECFFSEPILVEVEIHTGDSEQLHRYPLGIGVGFYSLSGVAGGRDGSWNGKPFRKAEGFQI